MNKLYLLDCTVNILSSDVSTTNAQAVPIVNIVPKAQKHLKCFSKACSSSLTETEEKFALKTGNDLVIYAQ